MGANAPGRGSQGARGKRLRAAAKRWSRLSRLPGLGPGERTRRSKGHVFFASVAPAAAYGADVTGLSPAATRTLAARSARFSGWGGRNRAAVMAIAFARSRDASDAELAPLVRYATEWWTAAARNARVFSPPELQRFFRLA